MKKREKNFVDLVNHRILFYLLYLNYLTLYRSSFFEKEGEKPTKDHARFMRALENLVFRCASLMIIVCHTLTHTLKSQQAQYTNKQV